MEKSKSYYLDSSIESLIKQELINSAIKHKPSFSSNHEGYAVILEEFQETKENLDSISKELDLLWSGIRKDNSFVFDKTEGRLLARLVNDSFDLIKESIQLSAMICKFIESQNKEAK